MTMIISGDNGLTYPNSTVQASAESVLQVVNAQAEADTQAVIDTKASALAKLTALGLSEDEVKALVG